MRDNSIIEKLKELLFGRKKRTNKTGELVKNISRNGIKDCFTGDDSLSIRGKHNLIKEDLNKKARKIIKKAVNNPIILLDYIESKGTIIVKADHMDKILKFFGEEVGFITPMEGFRALLFTIVLNKVAGANLEVGFKTPAMFALKDEPVNIYTISHQFHLWMSYINKLPGFEGNNMQNFRRFWNTDLEEQNMSSLSVDEIMSMQDIVAREMEALDFVREMAREFVGQKNSLAKLKEGKSINL